MRTIKEITAELDALGTEHNVIYEKESVLVKELQDATREDMMTGEWPRKFEANVFVAGAISDLVYENLPDESIADKLFDRIESAYVAIKISIEKDGTYEVVSLERVDF